MVQRAAHRMLDGRRVALAGDLDLSQPATSIARMAVDGRLHEMTAGDNESGLGWAEDLGVSQFDEEFSLQGGRLRIGQATSREKETGLTERITAVVWQGDKHSVYTHLYNARPADAVRFFGQLDITEHEDGMAVAGRPTISRRSWRPHTRTVHAQPADLVKEVPGLGLLEITPLTRETNRRLPSWSGTRVTGGELFQDKLEGQGVYFILATGSAVVTVLPGDDSTARQAPRQLSGFGGLKVEVTG